MSGNHRRVLIKVRGIVQGVGFRPYIYGLARAHGIHGWVRNDSTGVEVLASGHPASVERFFEQIPLSAPSLARVLECEMREERLASPDNWEESSGEGFEILQSHGARERSTLISPDVCTCGDCLRELFDPQDRRFRYPFINCTHCGPRYTIIQDIPYDRARTTMAPFSMCGACRGEYEDPLHRRFHAQPNACWECGPQVWLEDGRGRRQASGHAAMRQAVELLHDGAIVAVKGLGGMHLAVSATDEEAVRRLRSRKVREEKPFAVMFSHLEALGQRCHLREEEKELVSSPARPIVLLDRKSEKGLLPLASAVAPGNRCLGAFLPCTPLHFLLFHEAPYDALVMTSGNRSDEPIVTENEEARRRLGTIADYSLLHDRGIHMRCDDSVVRMHSGKCRPLRRARGYVPVPIFLKEELEPVLGVGAQVKNTICLTRGREAFVSQHVGDLENLETLRAFEHTIDHLKRILEIEPLCVVHDLHPDYLSTRWALEEKSLPLLGVQHHHAHIASVLAECSHRGPVLGVALDGTGYGGDGTLWGGELLRVDAHGFERLGHFRQVPMPGGEMAIREPWRMALSYLWALENSHGEEAFRDLTLRWPEKTKRVLLQMLHQNIHCPVTSSCGRLFDAVAALAGLRDRVTFEGQAAAELEQVMEEDGEMYSGEVCREDSLWILDPLPMVGQVAEDVRNGVKPGIISGRFHQGLVRTLSQWVQEAYKETGIGAVALSGGVFQNRVILQGLMTELSRLNLEVLCNGEVPANDACISLGQAFVGAHWLKGRTV